VLAATLDPIITIDGTGIIQSASDSVLRVFGWTADELIGMNVNVLMPEPHHSAHNDYIACYHKTGRTEHLNRPRQFEAMRKDGTFFPIEVCVSRVDVQGQTMPLFVGIIRDLSTRAPRSTSNAADAVPPVAEWEVDSRLQELLAEQTSALQAAHLKLRVADRMASIGALAAGLGHDMNNVLLTVRAHLDAARARAMIPEVRAHVGAVQKNITYLQQLADGLHFLAYDSEADDFEPAVTVLRAWWEQVEPLLSKAVPKHVKVSVAFPKGLPQVGISAHGLTQAVLNLVVNAGQAIPTGQDHRQGRVRIWAKTADRGTRVKLSVTDNGQGMSPEVQRNAFEMFYTTKTRGIGTGLGLPLVARVIGRAGGSVQIESELGKGTTVALLLPVSTLQAQRIEDRRAVITMIDGRAAAMIQQLLEDNGVHTVVGDDATEADIWVVDPAASRTADITAWRKRHPHVVLVLYGKPTPRLARQWHSLRPITIDNRDDLDGIRCALSRAIASL
jgi:PAS domain S-box-containing protein